ncbi:MAG: hypothetical protein HZB70_01150 [Candidatus Berkelbacteria bacterium]|nr:MAG: hypothetical protein HZB70_01150 [Candidatus Berkelbacteria bacterium]QQG52054.1 MAG: hypothetical protein HY845_01845 [Candidatus Berkelbacteria bacterium]
MFIGDRIDKICQLVALLGVLFCVGSMWVFARLDKPVTWAYYSMLGLVVTLVALTVILFRGKRYQKMWQKARCMFLKEWPDD